MNIFPESYYKKKIRKYKFGKLEIKIQYDKELITIFSILFSILFFTLICEFTYIGDIKLN